MSDENPYMPPKALGNAQVVGAVVVAGAPRLGTRQERWIIHAQYALRAVYVVSALFALLYGGQLAYVFAVEGPGAAFPLGDTARMELAVRNVVGIGMNAWITIALRRFDRALGQVREYDGAPAAVYRALRMSRNAWFAMAGTAILSTAEWVFPWVWFALRRLGL